MSFKFMSTEEIYAEGEEPTPVDRLNDVRAAGRKCRDLLRDSLAKITWLDTNKEKAHQPPTEGQVLAWQAEQDRLNQEERDHQAAYLNRENEIRKSKGQEPLTPGRSYSGAPPLKRGLQNPPPRFFNEMYYRMWKQKLEEAAGIAGEAGEAAAAMKEAVRRSRCPAIINTDFEPFHLLREDQSPPTVAAALELAENLFAAATAAKEKLLPAPPGHNDPGTLPTAQTSINQTFEQRIDDLVTLDNIAAIVKRSKRTLENYLNEMPRPHVQGGGGKPSLWKWPDVRPWLEANFMPDLPERFPGNIR